MIVFNGQKFAQKKEKVLRAKFGQLAQRGIKPKLAFILVGKSKEAEFYVFLKEKAAKRLGVDFETRCFSQKARLEAIYQYVNTLNEDKKVWGISFEYPLPKNFKTILPAMIAPEKDVDCLTPFNLGRLVMGDWLILPSSVRAVLEVLKFTFGGRSAALNLWLKGKLVVIVGFGTLVGRPLSVVLKHFGATVTICDEFSKNLADYTKRAEILVSATGQAGLIKSEMIKKGAVVLDLSYPKGDCQPGVAQVASFFTPVPGGLGPVTIACLFENLLELYKYSNTTKY